MDLSKVLNSIDHDQLLSMGHDQLFSKLNVHSITGPSLQWRTSYLGSRTQVVKVNGKNIKMSLYQHSSASRLLIGANTILHLCQQYFLPDLQHPTKTTTTHRYQHSPYGMQLWGWYCYSYKRLPYWGLFPCQYAKIHQNLNSQYSKKNMDHTDSFTISRVSNFKLSRIIINAKLIWKDHISHTCSNLSRAITFTWKLRGLVNFIWFIILSNNSFKPI